MRTTSHRLAPFAVPTFILISGLAISVPAGSAEAPHVPMVVAVDTSRSLSPADLAEVRDGLAGLLAGLPADTPVGLLSFNDQATWSVAAGSSRDTVSIGLGALAPAGNFTLLNDGLVTALRELPDGGLLLVATDGRDENSATTLEDVARRCTEHGVRIATVGTGRADEKILRRLALLTDGAFLGVMPRLDLGTAAREIDRLRGELATQAHDRATAAGRTTRPASVPAPAATPAAPGPAVPPTAPPARESSAWPVVAGLAAAAAVVLAVVLFSLLRRKPAVGFDESTRPGMLKIPLVPAGTPALRCPSCGSELDPQTGRCSRCSEKDLIDRLAATPIAGRADLMEVSPEDTAAITRLPYSESIEKTFVLDEENLLVVYAPGEVGRSYRLPNELAVSIGRDSQKNTLAFPDPTLSSLHFRLVPDGLAIHLVDLDSTNGVFLNGQRARHALLKPGDRLRAGLEEFEYKTHQQQLA